MEYNVHKAVDSWTEGAIYCYKRSCNCQGCYIQEILESLHCRMKGAVVELVRKFGAPPKDENMLNESQQKVVSAILAGGNTKEEIAKLAGITETNVATCLSHMYELAENDGVVYSNKRYKMGEFIKWIRGEI